LGRAAVNAVVFDVGETIMKDDTYWGGWADWLGVPRHTLSALVGDVTARGLDNAEALRVVKPGIDIEAERAARGAEGCGESISESDLYDDVRPALAALRAAGKWVGVTGNQTARAAQLLRKLNLPADAVATSGEWGPAKPDRAFFVRLCGWSGFPAQQIAYVGDHPANDIVAGRAAGLRTVHIRRGPWGFRHADDPDLCAAADWRIRSLIELPGILAFD